MGHLVTVQLPHGFAGTWVRNERQSRIAAGDGPVPDTMELGERTTYRTEHPVRDESEAAVRAMLALPDGAKLADKMSVEGSLPDDAVVERNTVKLDGDTVIVESEITRVRQGVISRTMTREHLSPDQTRLVAETSMEYPAYDTAILRGHAAANPGPRKRLLVFDRAQ